MERAITMTEPTFGISFLRDDNEPRPAITSDLSVVGLVGPMADAAEGISINDPIVFNSDDTATLTALGTNNYIADAVAGQIAAGGYSDKKVDELSRIVVDAAAGQLCP